LNTAWELLFDPAAGAGQIVTPGKVSGAALTLLGNIPVGAGFIPMANMPQSLRLQADTTINFTASMTSAQIQALIDAQPKDLGGKTLTAQFADGVYVTTAPLSFTNFYGGRLALKGNMTEPTTEHTNQAVTIDGSAVSTINPIEIQGCSGSKVSLTNLAVKVNTSVSSKNGVYLNECQSLIEVLGCYFYGTSTTYGYGITFRNCSVVDIQTCYVALLYSGIYAYGTANVHSTQNFSVIGFYPQYGMRCESSCIRKSGSQPAGTISYTSADIAGTFVG
jgi:hypothetical protein